MVELSSIFIMIIILINVIIWVIVISTWTRLMSTPISAASAIIYMLGVDRWKHCTLFSLLLTSSLYTWVIIISTWTRLVGTCHPYLCNILPIIGACIDVTMPLLHCMQRRTVVWFFILLLQTRVPQDMCCTPALGGRPLLSGSPPSAVIFIVVGWRGSHWTHYCQEPISKAMRVICKSTLGFSKEIFITFAPVSLNVLLRLWRIF